MAVAMTREVVAADGSRRDHAAERDVVHDLATGNADRDRDHVLGLGLVHETENEGSQPSCCSTNAAQFGFCSVFMFKYVLLNN